MIVFTETGYKLLSLFNQPELMIVYLGISDGDLIYAGF